MPGIATTDAFEETTGETERTAYSLSPVCDVSQWIIESQIDFLLCKRCHLKEVINGKVSG